MCDEQKQKFSLIKERESLIEKDVQRTDRTHALFEGEENKNLTIMKDILMTYVMYNFDLGYVQGMSDLLAPIMVCMSCDEVDSFWCFVGFMNKVEANFLMDQSNIKFQLNNLKSLLEFVDAKFADYLDRNESSNMYFCFRWILILFKREFLFTDVMRLWEVLWTEKPCKNFHLLICISILQMKKDDIIANNYGFNEILKFINDLAFRIDLDKTLRHAEGLYIQISQFKHLPTNICKILDLPLPLNGEGEEEGDEEEPSGVENEKTNDLTTMRNSPSFSSKSSNIVKSLKNSISNTKLSKSNNATSINTNSVANNNSSNMFKSTYKKDDESIEILN
jgi:hypothetical protein